MEKVSHFASSVRVRWIIFAIICLGGLPIVIGILLPPSKQSRNVPLTLFNSNGVVFVVERNTVCPEHSLLRADFPVMNNVGLQLWVQTNSAFAIVPDLTISIENKSWIRDFRFRGNTFFGKIVVHNASGAIVLESTERHAEMMGITTFLLPREVDPGSNVVFQSDIEADFVSAYSMDRGKGWERNPVIQSRDYSIHAELQDGGSKVISSCWRVREQRAR